MSQSQQDVLPQHMCSYAKQKVAGASAVCMSYMWAQYVTLNAVCNESQDSSTAVLTGTQALSRICTISTVVDMVQGLPTVDISNA